MPYSQLILSKRHVKITYSINICQFNLEEFHLTQFEGKFYPIYTYIFLPFNNAFKIVIDSYMG